MYYEYPVSTCTYCRYSCVFTMKVLLPSVVSPAWGRKTRCFRSQRFREFSKRSLEHARKATVIAKVLLVLAMDLPPVERLGLPLDPLPRVEDAEADLANLLYGPANDILRVVPRCNLAEVLAPAHTLGRDGELRLMSPHGPGGYSKAGSRARAVTWLSSWAASPVAGRVASWSWWI